MPSCRNRQIYSLHDEIMDFIAFMERNLTYAFIREARDIDVGVLHIRRALAALLAATLKSTTSALAGVVSRPVRRGSGQGRR